MYSKSLISYKIIVSNLAVSISSADALKVIGAGPSAGTVKNKLGLHTHNWLALESRNIYWDQRNVDAAYNIINHKENIWKI